MYRFEAKHDAIPEEERRKLSSFFSHDLMGEIALEWSELIRSSIKQDHELIIFKIYSEDNLVGIAILSVIRKLEITQWMSVPPLFKAFTHFNVGFVEIPLSNMSGILTREDIDHHERQNIMNALCDHIRRTIDIDILCIKTNTPDDQESNALLCPKMLPLDFPPNTLLEYPYSNFDEYLNTLSRKKRRRCLSDKRTLEKGKGRVERVHDIATLYKEIYALYRNTSEQAQAKRDYISMPVQINEDFFEKIHLFRRMNPCVVTVVVDGKIIAYSLLLQSGSTLFFKAVGLDYDLSYRTKAYFNLFYAALEYAGHQQCNKVDFGMTSYQFKQWLGCELTPATYLCSTFHPLLSFVQKPLVSFVERKIRSGGAK